MLRKAYEAVRKSEKKRCQKEDEERISKEKAAFQHKLEEKQRVIEECRTKAERKSQEKREDNRVVSGIRPRAEAAMKTEKEARRTEREAAEAEDPKKIMISSRRTNEGQKKIDLRRKQSLRRNTMQERKL